MRRLLAGPALALCVGAPAAVRPAAGQAVARTSVYVELLGNGGLYSLNLDRRLGAGGASVRAGFGSWTTSGGFFNDTDEQTRVWTVPVLLNALAGGGRHHLELGAGVLVGQQTVEGGPEVGAGAASFVSATAALGYRYQPPRGGWLFRLDLTPFYGFGSAARAYPDRGVTPSVGVSAGRSF